MSREEVFSELMESLYEISRKIASYESVPRKYGTEDELYMVEAHTINLIGNKIQTTSTELTELTKKTKGAISQMVDKLTKKGMIIKNKNPKDNREVILELSEKGKIVYEYHKKLDSVEYEKLLTKLDDFSDEDFLMFKKFTSLLEPEVG